MSENTVNQFRQSIICYYISDVASVTHAASVTTTGATNAASVTTTGINTDDSVTTTTTSATNVFSVTTTRATNVIGASTTTFTYARRANASITSVVCSMYLPQYMVVKVVVMIHCCLHVIRNLGHG